MKRILGFILIGFCFLVACNKNSGQGPKAPSKPLQIVISNITTTLTIYNFSVVNQHSVKLIDIYAQTANKTYSVDVNPGDTLKLNYFLELEGLRPAVKPVVSFIYEGVPMLSVSSDTSIVSGVKYVTIP